MFFRRTHRASSHGFSITDMRPGQEGVVTGARGGPGVLKNLENLGIRPGVKVKVVSRHFMKGPVVIMVGNSRVAVGFGMARKIKVRPYEGEKGRGAL